MPENLSSLSLLRLSLKHEVKYSRSYWGYLKCPVCDQKIISGFDMHEVFFTRGEVKGYSEDDQSLIFVRQNVVLVHPGNCHILAQHTDEYKMKCASQIIFYEGKSNVIDWIKSIMDYFEIIDKRPLNLALDAISIDYKESY